MLLLKEGKHGSKFSKASLFSPFFLVMNALLLRTNVILSIVVLSAQHGDIVQKAPDL